MTGQWNIRGALGAVTVTRGVLDWNLGGAIGAVRSLQLDETARMLLCVLGRIGTLNFTAVDSLESEIEPGPSPALSFTAEGFQSSSIAAGTIGTLNVRGEYSGSLTLTAASETQVALQSAHLERINDSNWQIRGSIGTIQVDDSATSWRLGSEDNLGNIRALSIGGVLHRSAIQAVGHIGSIRVGQCQVSGLTARSLGTLRVTGAPDHGLPGDFLFSEIVLTGSALRVGLGSVDIAGRVWDSTFRVLAGNVTSFTCARFQHSRLYVGYDPDTDRFLDPWRLGTFTTTSQPVVAGLSDLRTDGFQDSWLAAHSFGQITLTGITVNNSGQIFGLRVGGAAQAGRVRINTLPFTSGVNVLTGTIVGDFAFLA